jgi:hypothetical protein
LSTGLPVVFDCRILQMESEALADDSAVLDVPAPVDLRVRQAVALRAMFAPSFCCTIVTALTAQTAECLTNM